MGSLLEYAKYIDVSKERAGVKFKVRGVSKEKKEKSFSVLCDAYMVTDLSVPTGKIFSELFKERYPDFKYDFINISYTYKL